MLPRQVLPRQFYLITRRCTQRQFLLRPDAPTNNAFLYSLIDAASRCEIDVLLPCAMSNHYQVSPPASLGTRSTGVTGIQGPTRWRADGSSPRRCRGGTRMSSSSRCEPSEAERGCSIGAESGCVLVRSIPLSVEDEALGALGEALGDDLGVERVGEDLGPVLEQSVGRDAGRAMVLVALGDDLEGEVGLRRVHRQHREIVEDQEVG